MHDNAPEENKYCPSCGINVPVYTMMSSSGVVDRCQHCNTEIFDETPTAHEVNLGRIFVVEDTALIREMISDIMVVRGLASEVQACKNGAQFLSVFVRDLLRKNPPGLVMLDVVMPVMNGINAAVAMRAVEKAFGKEKVPILFFTVKQCDDSFKKVLKYCTPAMFINKGRDASPEMMHKRVEAVVSQLWKEIDKEG